MASLNGLDFYWNIITKLSWKMRRNVPPVYDIFWARHTYIPYNFIEYNRVFAYYHTRYVINWLFYILQLQSSDRYTKIVPACKQANITTILSKDLLIADTISVVTQYLSMFVCLSDIIVFLLFKWTLFFLKNTMNRL